MNAKEARIKTIESQYNIAKQSINSHIGFGKSFCYLTIPLFKESIRRLEEEGYVVSNSTYSSSLKHMISWTAAK